MNGWKKKDWPNIQKRREIRRAAGMGKSRCSFADFLCVEKRSGDRKAGDDMLE
ncbi:hypothetical protein [Blautia sp.]|uniref:hypothetical protein n=1 Tax=Blautia sp. TaxID=1955243 RepID=UPI0013A6F66D|nr:hypothetical protein [Blautia sp.]